MKVFKWNGFDLTATDKYVKETDCYFVGANGRRDKKHSSWEFLSQDKQEVVDYILEEEKRKVRNFQNKIEGFEEQKKKELEYLNSQLEKANASLESMKEKIKGYENV